MSEEYRAIKPEEFDECLSLWGEVFKSDGPDFFVPYFHGDPWYKQDYTRVCVVDGRIVSAVQVCEREIRVGDARITMGGIANVATHPDYRRRGYSSRLLQDSIMAMAEHGIDFSTLFTGIQPFYERLGWQSVPVTTLTGELRCDLPCEGRPRYSMRPVDWTYDIPSLLRIHEQYNAARPMTVVRTPDYWKGYAAPRFGAPRDTMVAEAGGRPAGYLFMEIDGENCWLREIGHTPGDADCARAMMFKAAVRMSEIGVTRIWNHLPQEPEMLEAFDAIADKIEPRWPGGMMCRVIDMESLGRKILPELNRRAREGKSPGGSVSMETEMGALNLTVRFGRVSLGAHNPSIVKLTQAEFFSLLFGIKSAEELGLILEPKAHRMVSALFPPRHPVLWQPDHF